MFCDSQLENAKEYLSKQKTECVRCGESTYKLRQLKYGNAWDTKEIYLCEYCYSDLIDWIGEIE